MPSRLSSDLLELLATYPQRKVGLFEAPGRRIGVSTVATMPRLAIRPYETAVRHPFYKAGEPVMVAAYDTREQAERGHALWIVAMTGPPPPFLLEVCNSRSALRAAREGRMQILWPRGS